MASMWRKAMLYLGLGPDEDYDDYDGADDLVAAPPASRPAPPAREPGTMSGRTATATRTRPPAGMAPPAPAETVEQSGVRPLPSPTGEISPIRCRRRQRRAVGSAPAMPDVRRTSGSAHAPTQGDEVLALRARRTPEAHEAVVGCRCTRHPVLRAPRTDAADAQPLVAVLHQLRRASRSVSTDGGDPGSRRPATSGVNTRVTAPTNPATISM